MKIRINTEPLRKLSTKLNRVSQLMEQEREDAIVRHGEALLEAVRRHASGRPGPNVVTGAYLGAMVLTFRDGGAYVSNPSPQSNRLEHGYVGVDSLGRLYNQPPFPHFAPALAEVRKEFVSDLAKAPLRAWRKA